MSPKFSLVLALVLAATGVRAAPSGLVAKWSAQGAGALPRTSKAAARQPRPACPIKVVAGESFGPVKIGMTREELERLGMPARVPPEQDHYVSKDETEFARGRVGPFLVELQANQVTRIRASLRTLPKCVHLSDGTEKVELRPAGALKVRPRAGVALFTSRDGIDVEVERYRQVESVNF